MLCTASDHLNTYENQMITTRPTRPTRPIMQLTTLTVYIFQHNATEIILN